MVLPGRFVALILTMAAGVGCARAVRLRPVVPLETQKLGAVEAFGPGLVATDDSGQTVTFANVARASVVIVRVWPGSRLQAIYPDRDRDTTTFAPGMHRVSVAHAQVWMAWPTYQGEPFIGTANGEEELAAEACFWSELRRQVPPPPLEGDSGTAQPALVRRLQAVDLAAIEDRCREAVRGQPRGALARDTVATTLGGYYVVMVASDVPQSARLLRNKLAGMDITASSVVAVLQSLPPLLAGSAARAWAAYVAPVR